MTLSLHELLPMLSAMNRRRDAPTSLTELARAVDRTPGYLQRTFKRLVGESPKQYDKRLRLEHAAALLLSTRQTVLSVALDAGFSSHEGFTRAFARHFQASPSAYRARARATVGAGSQHQAELLRQVGPCVGLYRAEFAARTPPSSGEAIMNYEIEKREMSEQPVLYQSAQCDPTQIAETLGKILPAVFGYATQQGIQLVGPPYARYPTWGPGLISMEAGMPVAPGAASHEDIQAGTLEACQAAVTIHTGPYEQLRDAHGAVERWILAQGLAAAGAPWEVYLTDPGQVPNPAEWKTQIVWPIRG